MDIENIEMPGFGAQLSVSSQKEEPVQVQDAQEPAFECICGERLALKEGEDFMAELRKHFEGCEKRDQGESYLLLF